MTAKNKTEQIHLLVTPAEKVMLKERAKATGKSLSEYLLDAGFETKIDSEKSKFYSNLNSELDYIMKTLFIQTKLIMVILKNQGIDPATVKEFQNIAINEAEKFFREVEFR